MSVDFLAIALKSLRNIVRLDVSVLGHFCGRTDGMGRIGYEEALSNCTTKERVKGRGGKKVELERGSGVCVTLSSWTTLKAA